jgi:hypothetical protein
MLHTLAIHDFGNPSPGGTALSCNLLDEFIKCKKYMADKLGFFLNWDIFVLN